MKTPWGFCTQCPFPATDDLDALDAHAETHRQEAERRQRRYRILGTNTFIAWD